jgi:hypothetical protein
MSASCLLPILTKKLILHHYLSTLAQILTYVHSPRNHTTSGGVFRQRQNMIG